MNHKPQGEENLILGLSAEGKKAESRRRGLRPAVAAHASTFSRSLGRYGRKVHFRPWLPSSTAIRVVSLNFQSFQFRCSFSNLNFIQVHFGEEVSFHLNLFKLCFNEWDVFLYHSIALKVFYKSSIEPNPYVTKRSSGNSPESW